MKINILKTALLSVLFAASLSLSAQTDSNVKAVMDNILTRASVRSFLEKPVEQDKIETMLRAAMAAPTDRNLQPWHFVVLNTPEAVAQYAGDGERAQRMKKTPLIIVVCADTARMAKGEVREIWIQDLSAATENLLLAAHALGLGAVWTTVHPIAAKVENVRKMLNMPANLYPMCAIRIGYPNPERKAEPKDKWDVNKITYGAWK
jgi:nitroreductase